MPYLIKMVSKFPRRLLPKLGRYLRKFLRRYCNPCHFDIICPMLL
jgi:hypothetical protein